MNTDNADDLEIEGDTNDMGLTKDEQAQFDQMRSEEVVVEGGEKADPALEGQGDLDDDDDAGDTVIDHTAERTEGQPDDGEKKRPRRVSWNTHERELKAREDRIKALEGELSGTAEQRAKLAERLEIINEAFAKKPAEEAKADDDPEPDSEADIFAHNKWLGRQLSKANARIDQLSDSGRQREADSVLQQSYTVDMQQFVAKEPNFTAAYNHLMTSRVIELAEYFFGKDVTAEGVQLTPQETQRIGAEIVKEEKALVKGALDAKESPSARMYRLAKARGFVPPAKVEDKRAGDKVGDKTADKGAREGKAPGALDVQARTTKTNGSVREEIESAKRAVADSASLSDGGGAPTITLTPERLATMPEEEFTALMSRLSPEQLALAMGGAPQQ